MKKNEILERIKGNIPKITTHGISAIAKLLKESEEYSIIHTKSMLLTRKV